MNGVSIIKHTRLLRYLSSVLMIFSGYVEADVYIGLPPPTASPVVQPDYSLWLTLNVDGSTNDKAVPVQVRHGRYMLDASVLRRNFIRLPASASGLQDVSSLPHVVAKYDSAAQILYLTIPENWLPVQNIVSRSDHLSPALSSPGILMNYDAYSVSNSDDTRYTTLWTEQRIFAKKGYFTNTGIWRHYWRLGSDTENNEKYIRYDTTWKYNDTDNLVSYQLGDVISNSLSWGNSVRLGGVRVSRNFSIRPDLVTYPMLTLSGTAAVPGSVDLFINGYKTSTERLNAGPWTLTSTPYINGAGEATVITTDALGRQVETTIPFYVSNQLLAPGLSDFDLSMGALRKQYGFYNADYNAAAFSGFYRYGLNNALTVSTQVEGRQGLTVLGTGVDVAAADAGTLSLSASESHALSLGQQYSAGYSWYSSQFGISTSYVQRNASFSDLSVFGSALALSRRAEQVTFSFNPLEGKAGTVGLGYFNIVAHDGLRTQLANFSWSRGLGHNCSLHLSLNKTLGGEGIAAQMQLIIPFSSGSSLSLSEQRSSNVSSSQTLSYSRAVPSDGGLGWSLAASKGYAAYHQADLTWQNHYTVVSGGEYGSSKNLTRWFDTSGSFVWMDDSMFASSKINDAFIVVSTSGIGSIPVHYENQLVGETDSSGHLLVPWVSAWYPAKVDIDVLNLPANINSPQVEKRVTVREGSGALVNFVLTKERPLLLTIVNEDQRPLPPGTLVAETASGQTTTLGYGGQAWFENVPAQSHIVVILPYGKCSYDLSLKGDQKEFNIGPLICKAKHNKDKAL